MWTTPASCICLTSRRSTGRRIIPPTPKKWNPRYIARRAVIGGRPTCPARRRGSRSERTRSPVP